MIALIAAAERGIKVFVFLSMFGSNEEDVQNLANKTVKDDEGIAQALEKIPNIYVFIQPWEPGLAPKNQLPLLHVKMLVVDVEVNNGTIVVDG